MAWGTRAVRYLATASIAVLVAAGCAVDGDGVLRSGTAVDGPADDGVDAPPDGGGVDAGDGDVECAELLATVKASALAVVGPSGLPAVADVVDEFNPGGRPIVVDQPFAVDPSLEEATTVPDDAHDAVVLDDHVVIARAGWLHVLDAATDEAAALSTTWLGSASVGRDPLLVAEGDGLLVVHETSARIRDQVDRAVRIARVVVTDDGVAEVVDSVEVLGSLAGLDPGDGSLRLAVRRGAPDLDLVQATTAGAEDAALEVNRAAIRATRIDDWVPLLRHDPTDGEPTETLIGGCDVVMPPGSETALGTTALLQLEHGAPLAAVAGHLVMGDSAVLFDGDDVWLMSSRNSVVGFGGQDGGLGGVGADRVVTVRLIRTADGYESEAAGIVAGRLRTPAGVAMADDSLLLVTSTDRWGQQLTLTSVGGTSELVHRDSRALELDWWGVLEASVSGDTVRLVRQGGSVTVDLSEPSDLDVEIHEQQWDRGVRVGPEQVVPFGPDAHVASSGGQIMNEWGSVENFFEQVLVNDFGGPARLEDWFGQPGEVRLALRDGADDDAATLAEWSGSAFGLWIVSVDPAAGSLVAGVAGLRDPDDPPILGGELFTGAMVFERDGERLVERSRMRLVAEPAADVGATDCERAQVDQVLLDVAGLWNAQMFTCAAGVGAGVVGFVCWGVEFRDVDLDLLQWQWGIDDTSALESELAALRAVVADGGSVIACRARPPIDADVPLSALGLGEGDPWVRTTSGVAKLDPAAEEISVLPLEPPYGD